MKPGGRLALGFTPYAGQQKERLPDALTAAGFAKAHLFEIEKGFCALAMKA